MKIKFEGGSPSVTVTINRGASQESGFGYVKFDTFSANTADGQRIGYSAGQILIRGVLKILLVNESEAEQFRQWVTHTLSFIKPFSIEPYGALDLGLGKGAKLNTCYLVNTTSTEELVKSRGAGNKFNIEIFYESQDLFGIGQGLGVVE